LRTRGKGRGSSREYADRVTGQPTAPPYSTRDLDTLRLPSRSAERDAVAVEEPLEIRIGGEPVAVTMRTPGHDEELALGFCITEGLSPSSARVPDDLAANTVEVEAASFDSERLRRHFYTSSSCGVCGKGAIEAIEVSAPRIESRHSAIEIVGALFSGGESEIADSQRLFADDVAKLAQLFVHASILPYSLAGIIASAKTLDISDAITPKRMALSRDRDATMPATAAPTGVPA